MSFLAKGQAGSLRSPYPEWGSARLCQRGAGVNCGDRARAPRVTGVFNPISRGLETRGRDKGNKEVACLNLWQPNVFFFKALNNLLQ